MNLKLMASEFWDLTYGVMLRGPGPESGRPRLFDVPALALGLLLSLGSIVFVAVSASAAQPVHNDALTYFYDKPDLDTVSTLIRDLTDRGKLSERNASPPVIGFLAALYERHPDRVDDWVSGEFGKNAQFVIGMALAISGMKEKAISFAEKRGWSKKYMDVLRGLPNGLDAMVVTGPSQLDILWGASFATGDAKFVDRILDKIEEGINLPEFSTEDVVDAAYATMRRNAETLKKLRQKLGDSSAVKLIPYSVALWGVASNAEQHEFVAGAVDQRIRAESNTKLAYALRKILFQSRNKVIAKADGQAISVMVSQTTEELSNVNSGDAIKNFMLGFQNHFISNDKVYLAVLVKIPPNISTQFSHKVTSPLGQEFEMGPFRFQKSNQNSIQGKTTIIDADKITKTGVYLIRTVFSDGPANEIAVENKLLILAKP